MNKTVLNNMAGRYRHDLGLLSEKEREGIITTMSQLLDEVCFQISKSDNLSHKAKIETLGFLLDTDYSLSACRKGRVTLFGKVVRVGRASYRKEGNKIQRLTNIPFLGKRWLTVYHGNDEYLMNRIVMQLNTISDLQES